MRPVLVGDDLVPQLLATQVYLSLRRLVAHHKLDRAQMALMWARLSAAVNSELVNVVTGDDQANEQDK